MEKIKMVFNSDAVREFYYWADERTRQEFWQDWIRLTLNNRREDEN